MDLSQSGSERFSAISSAPIPGNHPVLRNPAGLMQLQLTWGGGKETIWNGTISLSEGNVAFPMALGTGARIPGSFVVEEGKLLFDPQEKTAFNGFQITVFAPLSASLNVRLNGGTIATSFERTIPLKDLADKMFFEPIDSMGNRFSVQRAAGDDLAVVPKRSSLVFRPGETFHCDVFPRFLSKEEENVSYFLELRVVQARSQEKNILFEQMIPFNPLTENSSTETSSIVPAGQHEVGEEGRSVSLPIPRQSGVYDFVLSLKCSKSIATPQLGITNIFSREKEKEQTPQIVTVAQRTIQFVVVDTINHWAAPLRSESFQEKGTLSQLRSELLYVLDPSDPNWWRAFAQSSRAFVALMKRYAVSEQQELLHNQQWSQSQHQRTTNESSAFPKPLWQGFRGLSLGKSKQQSSPQRSSTQQSLPQQPLTNLFSQVPATPKDSAVPNVSVQNTPIPLDNRSELECGCSSRIFTFYPNANYSNTNVRNHTNEHEQILFWNSTEQSLHSAWGHGLVVNQSTPFGTFTKLTPSSTASLVLENGILKNPTLHQSIRPVHSYNSCREPAWGMYPIPIENPNEPHILEVEYLSNHPQSLGISILEPAKNGELRPIAVHSGLDVSNEIFLETPAQERALVHRVVFWPKSELPIILLSNQHNRRSALFGKIRIRRVVSHFPKTFTAPANRLFTAYIHRPGFAEYFATPFENETGYEMENGKPDPAYTTDWTTFYEGTNRLAGYLQWSGYGGAMISVTSDGSSLFPSEAVPPTPQYDSGIFLPHGEDPIRKDVVELIARIFDREKLTFIPAINFNATIPRLEERIRRENRRFAQESQQFRDSLNSVWEKRRNPELVARSGLFWIDPKGRELVQLRGTQSDTSAAAPHYNILHPLVQEAMLNQVHEILMRYANHDSFGGVAVQLSPDGFAQLPEQFWGMDDHTMAMFVEETRTPFPLFSGKDRFTRRFEHIQANCPDLWIRWRAAKVTDFYRRMSQMVVQFRPDAKLYLSGSELLESAAAQHDFYPSFSKRSGTARTLLTHGFDLPALEKESAMVFLRPQRIAFSGRIENLATQKEINQSDLFPPSKNGAAKSGNVKSSKNTGVLFYHRNAVWNGASFWQKSLFSKTENFRFEFQEAASGVQNRKRFIRLLARNDYQMICDGGLFPSLGQEESLIDFIDVFRQLPCVDFQTFIPAAQNSGTTKIMPVSTTASATPEREENMASIQPVVVRYTHLKDETLVYLLNEAPFRVDVRIMFSASRGSRISELTQHRKIPDAVPLENRLHWATPLKPYDFVAIRISDAKSVPLDVFVERPAEICGPRGKLMFIFDTLIKATQTPVPWNGPVNPDFEPDIVSLSQINPATVNSAQPADATPDEGRKQIDGWTQIGDETFSATLDTQRKVSGKSSLKLTSSGTSGGVVSNAFDVPATGRISVRLQLGILPENTPTPHNNGQKSTIPLRIGLTGQYRNTQTPFLKAREIDSALLAAALKNAKPVDGVYWCTLDLPLTQLPFNALDHLTVRIDLSEKGTVWIDDMRLNCVAFTESERFDLMKLIIVANSRLSNNRISDALDLLEGFWPSILLESTFTEGQTPWMNAPVSTGRRAVPAPPVAQQRGFATTSASSNRSQSQSKSSLPKPSLSKIPKAPAPDPPSFFQKMKSWLWHRN